MNRETLSELVKKSQGGDREALRELLLHAHTPVFYQCRKLLGDEKTARMLTEEILGFLAQKLDSLEDPDGFEKWVGGITAARAMRTLREIEKKESATPEKQVSFPSETLNKAQTAQVAALLADALPEKYRMCLILRTCCGLKPMAVGKLLGLEEETVDQYLEKAENAINHQMQRYREHGVTFAEGITLYGLLRRAMYLEPETELAEAAVAGILGVPAPVETVEEELPRRGLSAGQLLGLIAITVAVLVLVGMLLPKLFRNMTTALTQRVETAWAVTAEPAQEIEIAAETIPAETTMETETVAETETGETTAATETVPETTAAATEVGSTPTQASAMSGGTSSQGGSVNVTSTEKNSNLPADGDHKHNYIYMSMTLNQGPGCTAPGWSNYYCTVGREVVSVKDPDRYPPLGHDYRATVKEPTTTQQGYTFYTCYRCGLTYKDNFVDPLPAETEAPATQPLATENVPTEAAPTDPPVTEAAAVPQESTSAEAPATEAESE